MVSFVNPPGQLPDPLLADVLAGEGQNLEGGGMGEAEFRLQDLAFALVGQDLGSQEGAGQEQRWFLARTRPWPAERLPDLWRQWCRHPPPEDGPLHAICAQLRLASAECLALALAVEVELNPMAARALAWLQHPVGGTRPTVGLIATALARLDAIAEGRLHTNPLAISHHMASLQAGTALACGLLQLVQEQPAAWPEASLHTPVPLALSLAGLPSRWQGLERNGMQIPQLPDSWQQQLERWARSLAVEGGALAIRSGSAGEAKMMAYAVGKALGCDGACLEDEPGEGLGPWLWLNHVVPIVRKESGPGEQQIVPTIAGYAGPLLIAAGLEGSFLYKGLPVPAWTLPLPSRNERISLWEMATGDGTIAAELADYRHGLWRINSLAHAAEIEAGRWGESKISAQYILRVGRCGAATDLGSIAQLSEEDIPDEALVVSDELKRELENLLQRCRKRERLIHGLGPALVTRYRPGVRALLHGASGTGKSLAVEWLATRIGLPLYRVDLASVTSKYIGETEKNLAVLFARAENSDVILFFDEADALFGKRTETKDSNDRFANAQTNYLLQRIETFDGIVFLASNSRSRFDSAFTRRLDAIIEFPLPSPQERRSLWKAHLGEGHDLAISELNELAASCDLAGGHIRNMVLAAAAACHGTRQIGYGDIKQALAMEYRKLGKALPRNLSET